MAQRVSRFTVVLMAPFIAPGEVDFDGEHRRRVARIQRWFELGFRHPNLDDPTGRGFQDHVLGFWYGARIRLDLIGVEDVELVVAVAARRSKRRRRRCLPLRAWD
jgi:hypothetical protein